MYKLRFSYWLVILLLFVFVRCSNDKRLHSQLTDIATTINKSTPARLDTFTTFMEARVTPDNTFEYLYRIDNTDNPALLLDSMETEKRLVIIESFKSNKDLQIFTKNNLNINYVYMNTSGEVIKTIYITPKDYK